MKKLGGRRSFIITQSFQISLNYNRKELLKDCSNGFAVSLYIIPSFQSC